MDNLRNIYSEKALIMIPRLLSLQQRNEFSKLYGSFQRTFWLDRSDDFVNALPQFGVLSLSLVYSYNFPNNIFYKKEKIKKWALAGLEYWINVQKNDGSYDEFYPNERGWAGPTGFLLYAMVKSYELLGKEFPEELKPRFFEAVRKSAYYLGKYDEDGVLANHHAMALMPIYYAYDLLKDKKILKMYNDKMDYFLTLVSKEGWSLEYDGADLGYLSATVSFLAKLYKKNKDKRIIEVAKKSVEFLKYFVYPNNYYGGSMGSRQTLHFYPHGVECFADKIPLASVIADKMLLGLSEGKLVPPQIQEDRYFLYRIPEYLEAYIDYGKREKKEGMDEDSEKLILPCNGLSFEKHFPKGQFFIKKTDDYYFVENMAKGGVIKLFNSEGKLIFNDNGIIGKSKGKAYTSQWISNHESFVDGSVKVKGRLIRVPEKVFTPFKGLIFRTAMIGLGWSTKLAYMMKGVIRKMLIFDTKKVPVFFERTVTFGDDYVEIQDIIENKFRNFQKMMIGDEFFVRYVPQSMQFQPIELELSGYYLSEKMLEKFSKGSIFKLTRTINVTSGNVKTKANIE